MCGIAGLIGSWEDAVARSFRDRALATMECRGPDGFGAVELRGGRFVEASVGPLKGGSTILLVHRRLAIIDRSPAGAQPMLDAEAQLALTYNGEVYNFEALRAELQSGGIAFKGASDSEAVLHWLRAGRSPADFTGMFALALADARMGRLTLVRDAFGIKPLFFVRAAAGIAFASDIRVLLSLPGGSLDADSVRIAEYLRYGAVTSSSTRTSFESIEQLLPGSILAVTLDNLLPRVDTWYRPNTRRPFRGDFGAATRMVREAFIESVRLHLKSDVQVGCALSGGIDSSAVACTMRLLLGEAGRIHAVSHVASESNLSEEKWIDMAAAAAGAKVHKVRPTPADLPRDLDDLIASQGEPIAGTSLYAQYRVFAEAHAQGLTVMLDGQGADELFAGYTYYRAYRVRELLSSGDWAAAARLLRAPASRTVHSAFGVPMLVARTFLPVTLGDRLGALVGRTAVAPWVKLPAARLYYQEQERHRKARIAGLSAALSDSRATSLQGLLRYEDRNSMRFSIESRVPFLERDFVAVVESLPPEFLIGPDGRSKFVFREAMRGIVPDAILDRTDKIGFENDESRWLLACGGWVTTVLAGAPSHDAAIDVQLLRRGWQRFLAKPSAPVARRLWASLLYLRWRQLLVLQR